MRKPAQIISQGCGGVRATARACAHPSLDCIKANAAWLHPGIRPEHIHTASPQRGERKVGLVRAVRGRSSQYHKIQVCNPNIPTARRRSHREFAHIPPTSTWGPKLGASDGLQNTQLVTARSCVHKTRACVLIQQRWRDTTPARGTRNMQHGSHRSGAVRRPEHSHSSWRPPLAISRSPPPAAVWLPGLGPSPGP